MKVRLPVLPKKNHTSPLRRDNNNILTSSCKPSLIIKCVYCVGWPTVPALYNAPVFAASAVNVMAAQSVSIDKYPKQEQHQVGEAGGEIWGPPLPAP